MLVSQRGPELSRLLPHTDDLRRASDDSGGQHQLAHASVPLLKSILPTSRLAVDLCEQSAVGLFSLGRVNLNNAFHPCLPQLGGVP